MSSENWKILLDYKSELNVTKHSLNRECVLLFCFHVSLWQSTSASNSKLYSYMWECMLHTRTWALGPIRLHMGIDDIVHGLFILLEFCLPVLDFFAFLYRWVLPSFCNLATIFQVTCYSSRVLKTLLPYNVKDTGTHNFFLSNRNQEVIPNRAEKIGLQETG